MSRAGGQFWVLGVNWILGVCLDGPQIGSGLDVMKMGWSFVLLFLWLQNSH